MPPMSKFVIGWLGVLMKFCLKQSLIEAFKQDDVSLIIS